MTKKMKTCKSAKKRYSFTSKKKIEYKKQNLRHLLTKKSSKRKRNLGRLGILSNCESKRIKILLPYG